MARPKSEIPQHLREAVIELHAQEVGKNEIERRLKTAGLTRYIIDRISREEDLQWDRTKTKAAVETLKVQGSAQRAVMADRFLTVSGQMLDKLNQPYQMPPYFNMRENDWAVYERPEPPAGEAHFYVKSADMAMKRHQELIEFDQQDESEEAKSLLGDLQDALKKYTGKEKPSEEEENN